MAIPFLNNADFNQNQLLNVALQNLGTDPGSPVPGQIWYNTSVNLPRFWSGSAVVTLYPNATANTASTLVLRDASGNFAAGTITASSVTGLSSPSGSSDAATKGYVDAAVNGLTWKDAVRVASTANVSTSSAPSIIDGITLAASDRILLKNQSTGSQNGIYVFALAGAALTRATDADASAEVISGLAVFVIDGTVNADTGWVLRTDNPITLGSTALAFAQFSGAGTVTVSTPLAIAANNISLSLNARLVNNAGNLDLAASIVTTGTYSSLTVDTYGRVTAGADIITSNGIVVRTASGTFTNRSVAGTASRITITNGDGVSGNPTVDIHASYVGQLSITTLGTIGTGVWQGTAVGISYGGTGAVTTTAAFDALSPLTTLGDVLYGGASGTGTRLAGSTSASKKFLTQTGNGSISAAPVWATLTNADFTGVVTSYAADIGDGSSTSITVTHNLGTKDVVVVIRDNNSPYAEVITDVQATTTNTLTVLFAVAPATARYRVVVHA